MGILFVLYIISLLQDNNTINGLISYYRIIIRKYSVLSNLFPSLCITNNKKFISI